MPSALYVQTDHPVDKHRDDAGRQVLKLCQNMQIQFMVTGS